MGVHVGERAPVPGQAQARAEALDDLQRAQEFADGVGRVAVVEVQRDAPEQVVAGDQQAPLGLEQADVRRARARVSRTRPTRPGRCDADAGDELAIGLDRPGDAGPAPAALGGVARAAAPPERRSGARSPGAARTSPRGPRSCGPGARGWGASTPRSRRARRSWRPARSGRCARACTPPAAPAPGAGRTSPAPARGARASPRSCMPVSNSTKPSPRGDRPGIAVGNARPRQRQAQAVEAGQHALAAPELALARHIGHRRAD